jgi:hypothetical protein
MKRRPAMATGVHASGAGSIVKSWTSGSGRIRRRRRGLRSSRGTGTRVRSAGEVRPSRPGLELEVDHREPVLEGRRGLAPQLSDANATHSCVKATEGSHRGTLRWTNKDGHPETPHSLSSRRHGTGCPAHGDEPRDRRHGHSGRRIHAGEQLAPRVPEMPG